MRSTRLYTAFGIGLIAGAAVAPCITHAANARDAIDIRLEPTLVNAGKIGSAIVHRAGDRTSMLVTISGLPVHTSQPTNLHTSLVQGTCEEKGATAVPLRQNVLVTPLTHPPAFRGPVQMSYQVPVPFDTLSSVPFAVSVSLSASDGGREVFCGDSQG